MINKFNCKGLYVFSFWAVIFYPLLSLSSNFLIQNIYDNDSAAVIFNSALILSVLLAIAFALIAAGIIMSILDVSKRWSIFFAFTALLKIAIIALFIYSIKLNFFTTITNNYILTGHYLYNLYILSIFVCAIYLFLKKDKIGCGISHVSYSIFTFAAWSLILRIAVFFTGQNITTLNPYLTIVIVLVSIFIIVYQIVAIAMFFNKKRNSN